MQEVNLMAIFLTGLITGGLTCMAVQGGLLATTIAQREEQRLTEKVKTSSSALPILTFIGAKLIAYSILGFLLGWLGSFFQLSLGTQVVLQIFVALFMIGTALSILDVHPIFRYFIIQPPKFLFKLVRKQSKSADLFAPGLLGALTVFIPCGTTQAMMALAIASGQPMIGLAIMFAFILGTSPIFFLLGYFATKLGDRLHMQFMKFAAFAIILLAMFNLGNALALSGFSIQPGDVQEVAPGNQEPISEATITIENSGYVPNSFAVKRGSLVTLHLKNIQGAGCIQAFTIPSLNIQKIVSVGTSSDISFVAPDKPGPLPFMCSMGMYRGVITVL